MRMMQKPVKNGIGYHRIAKYLIPFWKALVRSDDCGFLFIPERNKLKEEVGVLAVQVKISYFIDYKQPASHEGPEAYLKPVLKFCLLQLVHEFLTGYEVDAVPVSCSLCAYRCCKVRLSRSGRATKSMFSFPSINLRVARLQKSI